MTKPLSVASVLVVAAITAQGEYALAAAFASTLIALLTLLRDLEAEVTPAAKDEPPRNREKTVSIRLRVLSGGAS